MFSEWHAGEAERLVREHGYDRPSPAMSPRERFNKTMAAQFRPVRLSFLGQGSDAEMSGYGPMLTHDLVDGARRELAAINPLLDPGDIEAATLALTGGERDPESQARAIAELAEMTPSELHGFVVQLASSDISEAERRELARKGWALRDGSYPIRDKEHLHSAAVLAASGHGDVSAARKLIRKRAAELGVDIASLPGFSMDDEDLKEEAARARRRHPRRGQDFHGRSTDGSDSFSSGQDDGQGGPSGGSAAMSRALMRRADGSLTTIALTASQQAELGLGYDDGPGPVGDYLDLAASEFGSRPAGPPFEVHDVGARDDGDPTDTRSAKEIARLLKAHAATGLFGGGGAAYGASQTHKPGSQAARRRAEQRELAGGRPQRW